MAGVALHGSYSRKELQKSLEIKLRAAYGDRQVIYPFFPGNDVSTFKRLVLRTSGQDWRVPGRLCGRGCQGQAGRGLHGLAALCPLRQW